jgi:U3 small nucleolar RNA-associated protein 13
VIEPSRYGAGMIHGNIDDKISLKAKDVVAPHDKDINYLSVSPNDGLLCNGS